VTHPASGPNPAAPAELVTLLAADTDSARDEAWAAFVHAFTATILRTARSLGGDADSAMDRYAFVLDRLHEDDCRRLRAYVRPGAGEFILWLAVVVRRLCLDHYRERYGRARPSAGTASFARTATARPPASRRTRRTTGIRPGAEGGCRVRSHGIKGSFLFTSLRSHPRFRALLGKMNLA
jgi:hypothetical protein